MRGITMKRKKFIIITLAIIFHVSLIIVFGSLNDNQAWADEDSFSFDNQPGYTSLQ